MRLPLRTLAACSLVLFSLAACGDDDAASPDAGPADLGTSDLGPQPSTLFGPCVSDSQCPGEGAICRRGADGFTGGSCTLPCVDRTQCDDGAVYHHCLVRQGATQAYCEQNCLNGFDCGRPEYSCIGDFPPSGGMCIGLCTTDAECGEGAECNELSQRCVATGAVPTTGSRYGEPCVVDGDCLTGMCLKPSNASGAPTGNNGGYCISYCILPTGYNSSDVFAGTALPSGTCTGDAVCFPAISAQGEGDLGACYDGCTSDADCRESEGYFCFQSFGLQAGGSKTFTNGICYPITNCDTAGCPTGYSCVASGSNSVCAPVS